MANKKTGSRYNLKEPVNSMMSAYCEAQDGISEIKVIRASVRHYIEHRIGRDDELREVYEAALKKHQPELTGSNVVPIKSKR